jgi:2-amino-4-hydroxy-6-hydroxymethyldihydropteridine diphosphokinase
VTRLAVEAMMEGMGEHVFVSVGSNLGDRLAALRAAVEAVRELSGVRFVTASPVYETEPWESEPGQLENERPWYLNCVIELATDLPASDLLERLQQIESRLGRTRPARTPEDNRFAARTVDIDILFFGARVISVPDQLHVPHLLAHERAFVLRPLVDLAPDLEHPTLYRTVRELYEELADDHEVRRSSHSPRWYEE